jgi:hypothetical protein
MHLRIVASILSMSLCLWAAIVRPPTLGRRLDKGTLFVVSRAQLARRLVVQMARGLLVAAEIAWAFVARLVSSCPVFLLLSGVLRGRHRDRRRRVRQSWRHVEMRHGLLHRRSAKGVHIRYVRVLHRGRRRLLWHAVGAVGRSRAS